MNRKRKMWGGRFKSATDPLVEQYTASILYDQRLYPYDIQGSIAWAQALWRAGVIRLKERRAIIGGLQEILKTLARKKGSFLPRDEDIHMAIERLLTERIGRVGGKLHTGRSRNDQVSLDMRLFLRHENTLITELIRRLQSALLFQARKHFEVVMPGYTHLQRAQPVLLSHHFLAYAEMLDRDADRFEDGHKRLNILPIGSGALAGTNFAIDRERIAKDLLFSGVTQNSLDAVSDRDFIIEFLNSCAMLMMHFSRLAEEWVLWSTDEFGFIEMPDALCTGSSLMPQKKNPDVMELIRGRTGRIYGHLMAMLAIMKALPLSYNRDLQEDKEILFDTVDTVKSTLEVLCPAISTLRIRKEKMASAAADGFLLATDLADYLVGLSLPFRKAHELAGQIVRYCWDHHKNLPDLTISEYKRFAPEIAEDVYDFLTVRSSLNRKKQTGSTAPNQVLNQIRRLERKVQRRGGHGKG